MAKLEELLAGAMVLTIAATTVALRSLSADQLEFLYDHRIGVFPIMGFYVLGITSLFSFFSRSWGMGMIVAMVLSAYIAIYHAIAVFVVEPVIGRWGEIYYPVIPRIVNLLERYFEMVPLGILGIAAAFIPWRRVD